MSSAGVKTTTKTEICSYSEQRIYPGRGRRYVARDGRTHIFINAKCASLFHQRIKPVRLTWTHPWRRKHKKLQHAEGHEKKKSRKAAKIQKAIMGLTLDEIKKKKAQKVEMRTAARELALKEAKERRANRQQQRMKAALPSGGGATQLKSATALKPAATKKQQHQQPKAAKKK